MGQPAAHFLEIPEVLQKEGLFSGSPIVLVDLYILILSIAPKPYLKDETLNREVRNPIRPKP